MTPPPAAAAATPAVHPRRRPLQAPRRPRRVSGPVRRPPRELPSGGAAGRSKNAHRPGPGLSAPARLLRPALGLASHPALDRLIRGRAWIVLVAFALIGIVTMQLGLLKLNAGIGRALAHEAALQRENSALSVENSEAAAGDTVQLRAARLGLRPVAPGSQRFLTAPSASGGTVGHALAALDARAAGGAGTGATGASAGAGASAGESQAGSQAATAAGASPEGSSSSSSSEAGTGEGAGSAQSSQSGSPSSASTESSAASSSAAAASAPAAAAAASSTSTSSSGGSTSEEAAAGASTGEAGGSQAGPRG